MGIKRLYSTDETLRTIQDNIDFLYSQILKNAMNGSQLVEEVSLISGQDNLISHGLTVIPTIFIVASLSADSTIWTQTSSQLGNVNANSRLINLRCSTSCLASFLFA